MSEFPGWSRGLQAALDRLSIAAPRPVAGLRAGPVLSRTLGRALEFADYRAYTPGDDPKLVDWRAYNRLDRLYLKQFREERARTIGLLVDGSASLDFGDGPHHKGLYARRLASALAWIGLGHMERVQTFVLQRESARPLPIPPGRAGAVALFRALDAVREQEPLNLVKAIGDAVRHLRGRGPVFLISDLLDGSWLDALQTLARREQADVVLQVLAPDEWDPPLGDEVELQDSESGELRQTRFGPAELSDYRSRLESFVGEISATARRLGLRHVAINTAEPLADTLLKRLPAAGILE